MGFFFRESALRGWQHRLVSSKARRRATGGPDRERHTLNFASLYGCTVSHVSPRIPQESPPNPAKPEPNWKLFFQRGDAETRRKKKPSQNLRARGKRRLHRRTAGEGLFVWGVRVIFGVQPKAYEHGPKCTWPKIFVAKRQEFNPAGTHGRGSACSRNASIGAATVRERSCRCIVRGSISKYAASAVH